MIDSRRMKRSSLLVICALSVSVISGCSAGDQSLEARRAFAVRFNTDKLASGTNVVQSKWSTDILSALKSTTSASLSSPRLASAVLVGRNNETYGLFVFWIENRPSVDGIEFRFSSQLPSEILPIPEAILKQNQAAAKDTIVFGGEFDWKETSEMSKRLESLNSTKGLSIRLIRGNTPVTGWFAVDFYKVDKWVPSA